MEASSGSLSLVGSVIADRYRIEKLLGEGGMGAVFLAEHILMRKRVALKLLHADMSNDEEVLARFRREAQAAARISHPNVAAATDFGQTTDGSFFLVLEYVEGTNVHDLLAARGFAPLPLPRTLHIIRQVAIALEKAHEAGIVHRDLKPDNIMLVDKDGDPDFVKVLDFGIARIEPRGGLDPKQLVTRYGTILGTPEYMSPEQAAGEPAGVGADFYSVGVTLYEMLTGKIPFDSPDRAQILNMHMLSTVPPLPAAVPAPIAGLVMRLLEKEAKNRPPDATSLRGELEAAAAACGVELAHVQSSRSINVRASEPKPESPDWNHGDSLAKTEYGLTSEPDVAGNQAKTAAIGPAESAQIGIPGWKLGPLDKLPRSAVIAILGTPFFILAFVLVVVLALATHRDNKDAANDAGAGISAKPKDAQASAAKIVAAKAAGVVALETLSNDYPNDAAVQVELARAYEGAGRIADMLKILETLDPKAVDDELLEAVVSAAQRPDTADDAFALLEGPLGSRGVDGLIELSSSKTAARARAAKAMARSEIRGRASPAATIYLDFRAANTCEAKHDLLVRAKDSGDGRLLPSLRPIQKKTGCGFLGRKDCWPCMRKDDDLDDSIHSIETRAAAKP